MRNDVEIPTCGKGLAAYAGLPARMGEVLSSLADNLEAHLPTIDRRDPRGTAEHDAYLQLIHTHREMATQLRAASALMAAHHDLAMAPHLPEAFSDPRILQSFQEFVQAKEDLARHIAESLEAERSMLNEMETGGSGDGSS